MTAFREFPTLAAGPRGCGQRRSDARLPLHLGRRRAGLRAQRRERSLVFVHRPRTRERALWRCAPGARTEEGDRVALILPTNEDFVLCFFGAIRAGIVPVPIYPPLGIGQLQGYLDNTRHIVASAGRGPSSRAPDQTAPRHRAGRIAVARAGRRGGGDPRIARAAPRHPDRAGRRRVPPVHERQHLPTEGRRAHARELDGQHQSASSTTASTCATTTSACLVAALPRHGPHRIRARAPRAAHADRLPSAAPLLEAFP